MTPREVAAWLHVHPNTVKRWADRGLLPYVLISSRGDRRYLEADVQVFIARQTRWAQP